MARDLQEINKSYTAACAQLGDLMFKKSLIEKDVRILERAIRELNKEGIRAQNKAAEEKANEQPAEAAPSNS